MYQESASSITQSETSLSSLKELVLSGKISLEDAVHDFEKTMIKEALAQTQHNLTHSAKMLGISRRMIKYKIDQLMKPKSWSENT